MNFLPSPVNGRPPRDPSAIERAALAWVARLDRGLSAAEQAEFERWLTADARHATLLREFEGTWTLLDRVGEMPGDEFESAARANPSVAPVKPRGAALFRGRVATLAAAAVVILGVLGWSVGQFRTPSGALYTAVAGTQVGELRTLSLPDGSLIRLNTASAVEVEYSTSARAIRLNTGEAHFTVAREPARPFTVSAGGVNVRAVGTAFNVRVRSEAVDVLVTAGRVRLQDDAPSLQSATGPAVTPVPGVLASLATMGPGNDLAAGGLALSAGEAISLPRPGHEAEIRAAPRSVALSPVEVERVLAWREQRLEFVAEPLAAMVAEFNRYNRTRLVIVDPALATRRFGGNFRADDPAGFVDVLAANFQVVAEKRDGEILLRGAP